MRVGFFSVSNVLLQSWNQVHQTLNMKFEIDTKLGDLHIIFAADIFKSIFLFIITLRFVCSAHGGLRSCD